MDGMVRVDLAQHWFNDDDIRETLGAIENRLGLSELNKAIERSFSAYEQAIRANKPIDKCLVAARDAIGYRLVVRRED